MAGVVYLVMPKATTTNIVQFVVQEKKISKCYNFSVTVFFFATNPWRGEEVRKFFPGVKFFSTRPLIPINHPELLVCFC